MIHYEVPRPLVKRRTAHETARVLDRLTFDTPRRSVVIDVNDV